MDGGGGRGEEGERGTGARGGGEGGGGAGGRWEGERSDAFQTNPAGGTETASENIESYKQPSKSLPAEETD